MKRLIFVCALTVAAITAVGADQKPGRGNPHTTAASEHGADDAHAVAEVRFSVGEQRAIHEYYAARHESLPPGLRKKVARGGALPPGWQKKMQPFPTELERRLGPLSRDCGRGVIDGHAVIYNTRSHAVIDVIGLF